MCQGCVNEGRVTQEAYDFTEAFLEEWPNSDYGPAHIVIADNNYEDEHILDCLEELYTDPYWPADEREPGELEATEKMLKELLSWSRDKRIGPKNDDIIEKLAERNGLDHES